MWLIQSEFKGENSALSYNLFGFYFKVLQDVDYTKWSIIGKAFLKDQKGELFWNQGNYIKSGVKSKRRCIYTNGYMLYWTDDIIVLN